jgi:phage antirepressor YoqD-like protein
MEIKMTNKEFAEEIRKLTRPKFSLREVAKLLGTTPQRLNYWVRFKPILDPDQECPFDLNKLKGE